MKIKRLYTRLPKDHGLAREEFLRLTERAMRFFASLYGASALCDDAPPDGELPFTAPLSLDDESPISELFSEAIVSYVEFLASGERSAYELAIASAEGAWRVLWRRRAKGKRLRQR